MRRALVPIDGSPSAMRALAHAVAELRLQQQAQIHLLNVQPPVVHTWPGKLVSPHMIADERHHDGEKVLAPAQAQVFEAGIDCIAQVRVGHPAEAIAACAAENGCDAIVMGTRGMGAVADLVLGSVAHKVVHLAPMPVTLVK